MDLDDRYPRAVTRGERIVSLVLLPVWLFVVGNYVGEWRLFGGFDKQVFVLVQLIGVLLVVRVIAMTDRP